MEPAEISRFSALVRGFALQAQVFMREAENPLTHEMEELDLGRAKNMIDMLSMLEEKTKGNLTPNEEEEFRVILTGLRMQYVRKSAPPS